ncbi:uncharacterized protein LOC114576722 [Exaiptasia diaphana]|uniref:J domain-containing protein n=1 Tax=Exaiptasia diaphana TaxID=2652724 RepID=A0A913YZY9_EXADI|nr:uncharacterized protein LOC114576722 [Exaiptasia diaphana]
MNKTLKECYEVLGVGLEATSEEIKRAYKNQALACHPDKNRDDPDAVQKFQELGYAYKKITSDDKDEEEDDWEDMFSDFDYWLEFFIYCMYEEGLMFDDIGCQHCCNCAHCDSDDDDKTQTEKKRRKLHKRRGIYVH